MVVLEAMAPLHNLDHERHWSLRSASREPIDCLVVQIVDSYVRLSLCSGPEPPANDAMLR